MKALNILDFGAEDGGYSGAAIQAAIDQASETQGGVVVIPAGTYISGTLNLKNASLYLERGAVLKASPRQEDYYENGFIHNEMKQTISLIYAINSKDIFIKGEGTIDLSSEAFFDMEKRVIPDYGKVFSREQVEECTAVYTFRPTQPIFFSDCTNITLKGISLLHSPSWTVSFNHCSDIRVRDLLIDNDLRIPNDDGLHFCGCRDVSIQGCHISCGDDCIALTSVLDWNVPCENFVISDCILRSCSKTLVLGYMHGIVRNVTISNCVVKDSNRAFCIMCSSGTGLVEHILIENIRLETRVRAGNWWGNGEPVCIFALYHDNKDYYYPVPDRNFPVNIRDIQIRGISCRAENVIAVIGENDNIRDVLIDGVYYERTESGNAYLKGEQVVDVSPCEKEEKLPEDGRTYWLLLKECSAITVRNVMLHSPEGKELYSSIQNCRDVRVDNFMDR